MTNLISCVIEMNTLSCLTVIELLLNEYKVAFQSWTQQLNADVTLHKKLERNTMLYETIDRCRKSFVSEKQ